MLMHICLENENRMKRNVNQALTRCTCPSLFCCCSSTIYVGVHTPNPDPTLQILGGSSLGWWYALICSKPSYT